MRKPNPYANILSMTGLNHSAIGPYSFVEKKLYMTRDITLRVSQPATNFLGAELSISDSSGRISRLGK